MNTVLTWPLAIALAIGIAVGGLCGWVAYPLEHPTPSPTPPGPGPVVPGFIGAPPKISVAVGRLVQIDTTGTASSVHWQLLAPPAKAGSPVDLKPINNGKSLMLVAAVAGTYWLSSTAVQGADIVEEQTEVDAGTGPTPPGPLPSDPFFTNLTQAWLADTDPAKVTNRNTLEGMYSAFATTLPQNIATYGDLFNALLAEEKQVLPTAFAAERKVCGTYLGTVFPSAASTPIDKALVSATFTKVAHYLDLLK